MSRGLCWKDGIEVLEDVENLIQPVLNYEQCVTQFIRERYSLDEELALNRQRDVKTVEFQEYFDYCEECKIRAKEITGVCNGNN